MPAKPNERQYRMMTMPLVVPTAGGEEAEKRFDTDHYVEGYASTFDDPYTLFDMGDGWTYREIVDPGAFSQTDMSDVILQYDHAGRVFARMSNNTLVVEPDSHGLFVAADLSSTSTTRELFEDIRTGLLTRMSWGFTIESQDFEEDAENRVLTARIREVRRIYDVSVVSLPADPNTEISARSLLDGEIQARKLRESQVRELHRMRRELALRAKSQSIVR